MTPHKVLAQFDHLPGKSRTAGWRSVIGPDGVLHLLAITKQDPEFWEDRLSPSYLITSTTLWDQLPNGEDLILCQDFNRVLSPYGPLYPELNFTVLTFHMDGEVTPQESVVLHFMLGNEEAAIHGMREMAKTGEPFGLKQFSNTFCFDKHRLEHLASVIAAEAAARSAIDEIAAELGVF